MNSIWISLKENIKCGSKMTDVARLPEKMARRKSSTSAERNRLTDEHESLLLQLKFRHYPIRSRFQELEIGDSSRNVILMIYRASSANPTKCSRKIKRVLKVKNSPDIIEEFEKYRETVKSTSYEHHPRSMVDGNEILQFYGTTISCCGRKTQLVSELCRDPTCRVCRIIQSGFNTYYNIQHGIRLSMSSEVMSEDLSTVAKKKNADKAVIICRTIAGRVMDVEGGECESGGDGLCVKPQSLVLRNPTAVLPCFVIVLDSI
ncbi:hypothetical protein Sango_1335600 [Sesamum angolense]|uniref:Nucleic acid binding protein n=1 Tax=Sesamum angolense TaxID=2727404 RepID=A0AAE2BUV6_9LAMI|nr:hypothetical protein Sango_1335600 [Sesamum angolense]